MDILKPIAWWHLCNTTTRNHQRLAREFGHTGSVMSWKQCGVRLRNEPLGSMTKLRKVVGSGYCSSQCSSIQMGVWESHVSAFTRHAWSVDVMVVATNWLQGAPCTTFIVQATLTATEYFKVMCDMSNLCLKHILSH